MTSLSKSDIEKLIKNRDPCLSYAKPRKASSEHWCSFSQVFVNGIAQNFICCSSCENLLSWRSGDGSSNLKKHIQYCRAKDLDNQSLITTFISNNSENNERLTRTVKKRVITAAAEFCAIDNRSFSLIEGVGFKLIADAFYGAGRSLNNLTPVESVLPNRTTISREVDKLFVEDRSKLVNLISSVKLYCATVDFWTESFTKVGYGGVSSHYFDDNTGLNTFILCCKAYELPSQHADNIRRFTENILRSFGLEINENTFIMSDNEPKMRAAFRYNAIRIGCSAHFLNKIIEHALTLPTIGCDVIQQIFNNVQDLVSHLRRSHGHSKLSKRLQIFSKTRWNSAYWMIHSFISVYPELSHVIKDRDQKQKLEAIDYNLLLEFIKYFKYFVDVTEALSGDKYPTIQLVIPSRQQLINLSKPFTPDSNAILSLKKYMFDKLPSYWELEDVHFMAVVLHPNFKHLQVWPSIKEKCYDLINDEIEKRLGMNLGSSSETSSFCCSATTAQQATYQDDDDIISSCFDREQPQINKKKINDEFDRYLNDATKLKRNDNVLSFWSKHRHIFPVLFSIAKDILIIPATNTAIERLFSASGNAVTNARTRLNSDKINKLMFLKKNHLILKSITNVAAQVTTPSSNNELGKVGNYKDLSNHEKDNDFEEEQDDYSNDDNDFFF